MSEDKALVALMKDQVEAWLVEDDASDWWKWQRQYALAADRIEALTAENERLREALKNASSALDQIASGEATWADGDMWAEDARAALAGKAE